MQRDSDNSIKTHWEKVYSNADETKLGWYQKSALPSLELIQKTAISSDEVIIDIGSGASILIDELLSLNYRNIVATDISKTALAVTKNRLDKTQSDKIKWLIDDLTHPISLLKVKDVAIWHDRAVLHFLTSEKDRNTYFNLLDNCVKNGKYVIIAAFNFDTVDKCSGLPVEKYDKNKLQEFLGRDYQLLDCFNYDYTMPSGNTRDYIYTLFQKKA